MITEPRRLIFHFQKTRKTGFVCITLRGGNFTTAYVYPKKLRATRDLLRRRTYLVRQRAQTLTHIQIVNHQHNGLPFEKKLTYKSNRHGVAERYEHPSTQASVKLDLDLLGHYDELIRKLELFIEKSAKIDEPQSFFSLQTIPGVGRILALTMLYEIHDIKRFPTVGQFLSYCRLVRGSHSRAKRSRTQSNFNFRSGHSAEHPARFSLAIARFNHIDWRGRRDFMNTT